MADDLAAQLAKLWGDLASLLPVLVAALPPVKLVVLAFLIVAIPGYLILQYHWHAWKDQLFIPNEAISDYVDRPGSGRMIRRILQGDGPYLLFYDFKKHYTEDVKAHSDGASAATDWECARAWCVYCALADRCPMPPHINVRHGAFYREVLLNDNSGAGVRVALGPKGWGEPARVPARHF